jgi:hypothetical protein
VNDYAENESLAASRVKRDRDAAQRARLLASASMLESERAQVLIDDFVRRAREANLAAVSLVARTFAGHRVKTNQRGWYLRNDHSVAIGTDGRYYQLIVPDGLLARFVGITLSSTPPSLIVGRGGKDGESGDLKDFLERALAGKVS